MQIRLLDSGGKRMKLFKSVDEKLSEIGFEKFYESYAGADYEKYVESLNFAHKVSIERKDNGEHLLWSYAPDMGNIGIGLTGYEMKLFLKKMKQMGLYSK